MLIVLIVTPFRTVRGVSVFVFLFFGIPTSSGNNTGGSRWFPSVPFVFFLFSFLLLVYSSSCQSFVRFIIFVFVLVFIPLFVVRCSLFVVRCSFRFAITGWSHLPSRTQRSFCGVRTGHTGWVHDVLVTFELFARDKVHDVDPEPTPTAHKFRSGGPS